MVEAHTATRVYQQQIVQLRALTYRDIAALWALVDPHDLDRTYPAFGAAALQIVQTRRGVAVRLAEEYYRGLRAGVGVRTPLPTFRAPELADRPVLSAFYFNTVVATKIGVSKGRKHDDIMAASLVRNMGAADKYINDGGREWIRAATDADPASLGWRRVTLGTCDFCKKMAADPRIKSGKQPFPRHDHCGCQPQPEFNQVPIEDFKTPGGWDRIDKGITRRPPADAPATTVATPAPATQTMAQRLQAARTANPTPVRRVSTPAAPRRVTAASHADDAPDYMRALPLMSDYRTADTFGSDIEFIRHSVTGVNPEYRSNSLATINCQKVTTAYELRRRGYDVLPDIGTGGAYDVGRDWVQANGRRVLGKSALTQESLIGSMASEPVGARFIVQVEWASGSGHHVFNAEKMKDGTIRFFDAQTGEADVGYYLSRVKPNSVMRSFRVDNATPSNAMLKRNLTSASKTKARERAARKVAAK